MSVPERSEYRIAHLFADHGVESEVLARFGRVERYTIDPRSNPFVDETVQIDLMDDTPDTRVDLALLHPNCAKYCDMPNVDPADHDNQIPRARKIAETIAEEYVIENKPRAPLRDPVVLNGKMFGLPIQYERAFEASFAIESPPRQLSIETEVSPYFLSDRTRAWWEAVKGYAGEYPKQHLAKNALPAAYVLCIVRSWLKVVNPADAVPAQDNNGRAPRTLAAGQQDLESLEVSQ